MGNCPTVARRRNEQGEVDILRYLRGMDTYATRASLFLRLKATDPAPRELAWTEFQRRYAPVIAGFARKMGCPASDVDELVQEVVVGFYEAHPRFVYDPQRGRFRGFLKTVVWRTLNRRRGGARRFAALGSTPIEEIDPSDPATADAAVEAAWEVEWQQQLLRRAIEQVRAQYENNATFRAFELATLQGRSIEEAATAAGISVDSAYKAKQRVAKAVREAVQTLAEEEG